VGGNTTKKKMKAEEKGRVQTAGDADVGTESGSKKKEAGGGCRELARGMRMEKKREKILFNGKGDKMESRIWRSAKVKRKRGKRRPSRHW